jgi:hypothetical protein
MYVGRMEWMNVPCELEWLRRKKEALGEHISAKNSYLRVLLSTLGSITRVMKRPSDVENLYCRITQLQDDIAKKRILLADCIGDYNSLKSRYQIGEHELEVARAKAKDWMDMRVAAFENELNDD